MRIIGFLLSWDGTGQGDGVELRRKRVTTPYNGEQLLARIIGKSPDCPCFGIRLRNSVAVHVIEAAADIVVIAARSVSDSFFVQLRPDDLVGAFRRYRTAVLRLFTGFHFADLERGGFGTEEGIGVVAEDRHARGVLALVVNLHPAQAGVVVVDRLPYQTVVCLCHFALHAADDPYAASRKGGVDQKRMDIRLYQGEDGGEALEGNAVYIHHDKARESLDMGVGSSSLQEDRGDKCRLCVLEVALGEFPLLQLLRVACCLDGGQGGEMCTVMTGGGGVSTVGNLPE